MKGRCDKCRWWQRGYRTEEGTEGAGVAWLPMRIRATFGSVRTEAGECRIYAPNDRFPTTHQSDWCGDFQTREG